MKKGGGGCFRWFIISDDNDNLLKVVDDVSFHSHLIHTTVP